MDVRRALREEREAAFYRLRGGYPIALAGAVWWGMLGWAGYRLPRHGQWIMLAFYTSGLIFPLAILLARVCRVSFLSDRTAVTDVLLPAFVAMLLFWPVAISAFWACPDMVPLVLGIGLSVHWPVIGWTYARTGLYVAHAVVRAVACFVIWNWMPWGRFTVLPLAVCAVYLGTVVAMLVGSAGGGRTAVEVG